SVADECRCALVELVELEPTREVPCAVALEDPVGAPIVQHGPVLDSRRGPDRTARKLAELDDSAAPLIGLPSLPIAAVGGSDRPDAWYRKVHRLLLRLAGASATSEQRDTGDQRKDGAGVAPMRPV